MDTESFRVIYPQGCDSLAKTYGYKLEKYKTPLSRSSGYIVGQGDGRLMPVVLHAYNTSNGSVAWAPKRMDLFSIPTAYEPEPMPWSTMLSVHEGRHVTQMQFGMTGVHKPFNYVFGEMWNIRRRSGQAQVELYGHGVLPCHISTGLRLAGEDIRI